MTERELVYQIINTARNAEYNNDESLTERLVRSHLLTYRTECLRKYYKDGVTVNDEVFQLIDIKLERSGKDFSCDTPKIIRFPQQTGYKLMKGSVTIPIIDSESHNLNKKNPFNKLRINASFTGNKLNVSVPDVSFSFNQLSEDRVTIQDIQKEVFLYKKIDMQLYAVLQNPSDDPNYDWQMDEFPFPSEREEELKQQILRKEFGIMVEMKKDEVQNSRQDNMIYQDEFRAQR